MKTEIMKREADPRYPVFPLQMSSNDEIKNCDLYPHQSVLMAQIDEKGRVKVIGRRDFIHPDFPYTVLDEMPVTKSCPKCRVNYPLNVEFDDNQCKRCTIRQTRTH